MKRGRLGGWDALVAFGLALVVAAVFCIAYDRTSLASWNTPVTYRGDSLFLLGYLKAAQDGHVVPGASLIVPELNAPFGANWNDHPRTLRTAFLAAGLLSRHIGIFTAINLLLLLAHILAAVSFYLVARVLAARIEWALAGGVAFGLAHFFFWRTLDHLDLVLAWHVPLCVLVSAWAFSRRGIPFRSARFAVSAAVVVAAGLQNPYYACLFVQFLLLAALAQSLRGGSRGRALSPLVLTAALAAVFVLDNAGSLLYQWQNGSNGGALRPYGNLERFCLKPMELLFPAPGFGLGDWGQVARVHWDGRIYKGEGGSQYLGLVGVAAFLWLGAVSLARLLSRPAKAPPSAVLAIAWIIAFSMLGGLNQLVGLTGFIWLRGANRFSIWILALVLVYLCTRKLTPGLFSVVAASAVAALAIADQVPFRSRAEEIRKTSAAVASDRHFTQVVESTLPRGAMLFMLPVTEFPEGRPSLGAMEYDNLRPYLHSERLRFSFGTDKGRPRDAWQQQIGALPPSEMASALETRGFDGIVVNRRAYPEDAAGLLEEIRSAGHDLLFPRPGGDFALVLLRAPLLARQKLGPGLWRDRVAPPTSPLCGGGFGASPIPARM